MPRSLASAATVSVVALLLLLNRSVANAALGAPGQPVDLAEREPGGALALMFQEMGDMGISAQMMFLSQSGKVYVLDKTENNPVNVTGKYGSHPAWAVEYDPDANSYRTMDVFSNTFCAGGALMGNGTWVVFGGNQPVTTDGVATSATGAYSDTDGGTAIRMLNPCSDKSCDWIQGGSSFDTGAPNTGGWLQMTGRRWYPMVEVLEDGTLIVIGGDKMGGYINSAGQDNPTYEFFPPRANGQAIALQFLSDTLPLNLYPLTWLMPSGRLFMQANLRTILLNYTSQAVINLPDMPYAARVYPASAATAMLPLTPANDYEVTLLFCGGSNPPQWGNDGGPGFNITAVAADGTCVRISPESDNTQYKDDDSMLEGRSMGQFVYLPDGTLWLGGGVGMGTAGYGSNYSIGQSYGQAPIYMPAVYNFSAPPGSRWNHTGLTASNSERMYHSTSVLLPDSSILISGSNPNADFTTAQWRTRTDVERWYPWYYNNARPTLSNAPSSLSYGGQSFDIPLGSIADEATVTTAKVVLIRGSFHTHVVGFGYRFLQLQSTYTMDLNTGSSTLHVSQLPGNPGPTLFQPGPALMFLVVDNVPSIGQWVMVGNGKLGPQSTQVNALLPTSKVKALQNAGGAGGATATTAKATVAATSSKSAAERLASPLFLPSAAIFTLDAALLGLVSSAAAIALVSASNGRYI